MCRSVGVAGHVGEDLGDGPVGTTGDHLDQVAPDIHAAIVDAFALGPVVTYSRDVDGEPLGPGKVAGLVVDSTVPNDHPHRRRVYFHDPDGNDWEFIQYLTDDPALRHDYTLPG